MTKRNLVIDTNIISHALAANQTVAYAKLLEKYQNDYMFCITGFTQYELLCSSSKSKQDEVKEFVSQNLTLFELSQPLMDFTARVYNLYTTHKSTKGLKITNGDIVNASLAIIKGVPIMTIDNNDYPNRSLRRLLASVYDTSLKKTER